MWILVRTVTYATLFVGLLLVFLPTRLLAWSGITRMPNLGIPQVLGILVTAIGAAIALWCIFTFAFIGKGTPAPFDPPRRLVVRGPYRFVRNPMYIGAALALFGAAVFYESIPLLIYVALFVVITHLFVVLYEEPTLSRTFGQHYHVYRKKVRRWLPSVRNQEKNTVDR